MSVCRVRETAVVLRKISLGRAPFSFSQNKLCNLAYSAV